MVEPVGPTVVAPAIVAPEFAATEPVMPAAPDLVVDETPPEPDPPTFAGEELGPDGGEPLGVAGDAPAAAGVVAAPVFAPDPARPVEPEGADDTALDPAPPVAPVGTPEAGPDPEAGRAATLVVHPAPSVAPVGLELGTLALGRPPAGEPAAGDTPWRSEAAAPPAWIAPEAPTVGRFVRSPVVIIFGTASATRPLAAVEAASAAT